jgi:YidC/Oxa1 family membrane protein insertase
MDRNQAIGLVLITVIMMGYFLYFGNEQKQIETKTITSEQVVHKLDSSKVSAPVAIDTAKLGSFSVLAKGEAKEDKLSNTDMEVTFNSKGGTIDKVLLKKYKTYDQQPLYIIDKQSSTIDLLVSGNEGEINLKELFFAPIKTDSSITYRAELGSGQYIDQIYKLGKEGYLLNYELKFTGLDKLVKNDPIKFNWNLNEKKVERDLKPSRERSTVNYYTKEDKFDHLSVSEKPETEQLEAVKWVSLKQKFFSTAIIATNTFEKGFVSSSVPTDSSIVKILQANLTIPTADVKSGKGTFQYYFGPNQFDILNKIDVDKFHKNVDLGWPVINWVNRFIVIPIFHVLESFIGNYGIIIIILVILLKLILFPLSYKSYVAMAKMKVLKPEIDEIKERHEGDMQKSQMETMELYRKVGINPLSGCIPVLLQMPILLAMFNFFPNSIELRQEPFLWANDLSTFDALFTWNTQIPLLSTFYGNHFSMFTFLMTISTLVYTWYNNQVSTVTGPMKTVSYVMPVVFMFVLNSFPAGLSFYYFVSNIITIGQQAIIRKFVDEDKIKVALEENKKKSATNPNKKSRWMNRLEDAMKVKEEEAKKRKKK